MGEPEPLRVRDALDKLVNQFADPLSFFRELIQNAMDAGSQEVEILCDFETKADGNKPDDEGALVLQVNDWGEGMNREIIEKQLTRLFSSAKDGDRTKIGKFGIGFVSVFAIEPDAVCVDTAREGECWRVVFDTKREFSLRKLDQPVDGTKIKIIKAMTRAEFEKFKTRARRVVTFWCKHVPGEIRFGEDVITGPLDIDAPCKVRVRADGVEIVAGHSSERATFAGLYNSGLTLSEDTSGDLAPALKGVVFKASSPGIEHTLTRDSVIRDANFYRVLEQVDEVVHGPLCSQVFKMLEPQVVKGELGEEAELLLNAAAWHMGYEQSALPIDVLPRFVARTPAEVPITLEALMGAVKGGEVFITSARSPLTDALKQQGKRLVLHVPAAPSEEGEVEQVSLQAHFLSAVATRCKGRIVELGKRLCMPLPASDELEEKRWSALAQATAGLMKAYGAKLSGVRLAHFNYPESGIADRIAITQREYGEITDLADAGLVGTSFFSRSRVLVVNADHPLAGTLIELARSEPEFAAYQLVKLFFLGERLDAQLDARLAKLTMERRWQQSSS